MTNLQALLEQATKRPWETSHPEIVSSESQDHVATCWNHDKIDPDESEQNAALIAIAVNHFAELVAFAKKQTRFNRETLYGFERELFNEAEALLARIEAAAKGYQC